MNRAIRKSRLIFNACRIILKTWRWSGMTAIKTTKGFSGLMSGTARVIYHSKNDASSKTFDALYWLAQLTIHIPNRGEQMCRYYGYYSNKSRGMRNKSGADDAVPALMEPVLTSRVMQKSWARPIQKIYHVDLLLCPKCKDTMKIIAFIEEPDIIRRILAHIDIWDIRNHDPPVKKSEHIPELTYDDSCSQLPFSDAWMQ
jgi:hypothetical protein